MIWRVHFCKEYNGNKLVTSLMSVGWAYFWPLSTVCLRGPRSARKCHSKLLNTNYGISDCMHIYWINSFDLYCIAVWHIPHLRNVSESCHRVIYMGLLTGYSNYRLIRMETYLLAKKFWYYLSSFTPELAVERLPLLLSIREYLISHTC
jgi:hypothetical protein